jgi:hypothetical protein
MAQTDRVAVLIDCDNISWQLAKSVIAEAAKHGTLSVKRAYGDWSSDYLRNWKPELPRHAIQPIQQPSYTAGKNSTDAALIIDAMDLLYAGNVDVFCIVSSDSDFTRLAMRIRESGRRVYGIGAQKTPVSFRNACDRFTFTEVLTGQSLKGVAEDGSPPRTQAAPTAKTGVPASVPDAPVTVPGDAPGEVPVRDGRTPRSGGSQQAEPDPVAEADRERPTVPALAELIVPAIRECGQADGWAYLSSVGAYVVNNEPSFDSRNYGYARLGQLVGTLPFVEVKDVPDQNDFPHRWVRLRPEAPE